MARLRTISLLLFALLSASCWGQIQAGIVGASSAAAAAPITAVEYVCLGAAPCGAISGAGPHTVNLGTNTTSGELIVVATQAYYGANYGSVTDSASQAYSQSTFQVNPGNPWITLWYKCNSASGVSSITWTPGVGTDGAAIIVAHYTGIAAACHDKSVNSGAVQGAASFTGASSGTLSQTNELVVAIPYLYAVGDCPNKVATASGSWAIKSSSTELLAGASLWYFEQIVNSTSALAATGTTTATSNCLYAGIDSFKGN